jgi:2-oxoglutarate dehydrogenase E2 component (dihydrolipoamide succinyltransferase)
VAGTVLEIRAQEGDTVPVGAVLAVVGAADAATVAAPAQAPAAPVAPVEPVVAEIVVEPEPAPAVVAAPEPVVAQQPAPVAAAVPQPTSAPAADNRLLSPVVRRLVAEHAINPDDLTGTGPGGRITRDDVLDHIDRIGAAPAAAQPAPAAVAPPVAPAAAQPAPPPVVPAAAQPAPQPVQAVAPAPVPAAAATAPAARPIVSSGTRDTVVPLSKIRRLTAAHMVMSLGVSAHAFSVVEVDYANVDATRSKAKAEWKATEGFSLTYLPFIARSVIEAIHEFPHLNASVGAEELVVHDYVDLGIAVDLDYEGLLVPVVRSAEGKRLRAIAREINDLAGRARSRKVSPDEISGGTFTITNNGSAGSALTMPIINQPQVAILSTDAIERKPVVATMADGAEAIVIHPVGKLAMSWDHRAFDGAYAAGFLVKIKQVLETRDWSVEL